MALNLICTKCRWFRIYIYIIRDISFPQWVIVKKKLWEYPKSPKLMVYITYILQLNTLKKFQGKHIQYLLLPFLLLSIHLWSEWALGGHLHVLSPILEMSAATCELPGRCTQNVTYGTSTSNWIAYPQIALETTSIKNYIFHLSYMS